MNSTAFKANSDKTTSDLYLPWVDEFKSFYQQFPLALEAAFRESRSCRQDGLNASAGPKLWKIIGDEIVFCCRLESLQHLSCATNSFLLALEEYGSFLQSTPKTKSLDVKGAGWVAAFPHENISLEIVGGNIRSSRADEDYVTEAFEAEADEMPHRFDFLGPAIDAGFRSSKSASSDRFAASVELAYLLAESSKHNMFSHRFSYDGRTTFKGVHDNTPYPVVTVETERDAGKRELRSRERILTQEPSIDALAMKEFLKAYMDLVGVEAPLLRLRKDSSVPRPSLRYRDFKASWEVSARGTEAQDRNVDEAESRVEGSEGASEPLNPLIKRFAEHFKDVRQGLRNAPTRRNELRKRSGHQESRAPKDKAPDDPGK